ncbi:amidohydrolase [Pandoraea cepalis]|uniref:Amidohydrolase n=1 Tax=Pandoraea cepalis TaxID=2508294 RepID=A0A5E4TE16_9BURK|nr:M20 aminoacylase family protein [Pandoraea cepalis]VVD84359.1 amidohydrolase [Pandoraea cepalis]
MQLIPEILANHSEMSQLRRDLHTFPELSFEEIRTSDVVAQYLERLGIEVHRGLAKTGVVGILRRGTTGRMVGLRADMDALPIEELNTFPHRSLNFGKMHACGHDGHTAMLLGAARYLSEHGAFDGCVVFIFQPAEERGGGARVMIDDGLFANFPVEAVFGLHNWPGIPAGHFGVTEGPIMASSNEFRVDVRGIGSHAALPQNGRDPVFCTIQIANALQGIVTRFKDPADTAVLSITHIQAGDAPNVVPDRAWLGGTVRALSRDVLDLIEMKTQQISQGIAQALECTVDVSFNRNCPATINTSAETRIAIKAMEAVAGPSNVTANVAPTMGSEDFAHMLNVKPGCYAFIGNGNGDAREFGHGPGPCVLHNASYDFNDDILPVGSTYWVRLVERFLPIGDII